MHSHLPPPRTRVLIRFHLLIVSLLLLQLVLPGIEAARAASPGEADPLRTVVVEPRRNTLREPLTTAADRTAVPFSQSDNGEEDITIVPPLDDRPSPEPVLPVPLLLTLESDRALLQPGEIAYLTLNAWRATEEKIEGLALTVTLPKMLEAVKSETPLRWALPELKNTEIFSQSIAVQLTAGSLAFESAVVTATVQTEATDQFSANGATVLLGLEAAERRPPEELVTSAPLDAEGLVLQGRYGDVTLLIEPGSAERSTDFTYTDGYRWKNPNRAAEPPPTTISITPTVTTVNTATVPLAATGDVSAALAVSGTIANRLYLPFVNGGEGVVTDATAADEGKALGVTDPSAVFTQTADTLLLDNGVSFVRQWHLDAAYQGQARRSFDKWLHMTVDAGWLIEEGFNPNQFTLYSRESADDAWRIVPTTVYDDEHKLFRANIPHFTEYGLGLSNSVVGESLPDVSSFSTDLFTGAATLSYPIEVPAGSGGMAPALGLHYSSSTVDTFRKDNYKNTNTGYRVQAGLAGLGWDIGGTSYIAFVTEGENLTTPNDNLYSIVLNGTSNIFQYGQTVTESFAKIEKNLTTVTTSGRTVINTGEWIITTPDGTKHYFGGPAISPVTSSTTANQGVMLWNPGDSNTYRVVNKWYLRKSVDLNGNYIEYNYTSVSRNMTCSTNGNYNPGWYYRSIRPASISWGGNQGTSAGHKMQAVFSYESRTDYQIFEYNLACSQSMYSTDRLKKITVNVYSESAWHPLREYELGYTYSAGYYTHSWLNTIKHYGFTGTGSRTTSPLNTYTFDYTVGAIHSEVYMLRADNGWGGKVEYTYGVPSITDCYIDHNAGTGVTTTQCAASTWRRQVTGRRVYDGVVATGYSWGGWVHTSFGYGAGLSRTFENEPMEFLGYPTAWSITYAKNSTGTEAKVTEHWFYRNNGYTANADIANNPDPRLGRVDYERVLQPGTSGCATIVGARCQMAATDNVYTALTGSGASWSATSSYTARPRWVRQDSVVNWADGAAVAQVFSYDTAKQNNTQFGNITKVQERDGSVTGTVLRWTETEYFPNSTSTVHIVNRPARVRVYDGSNNCKAEMRTTYDGNGGTYNAVPTKGLPSRSQQALTGCSSSTLISDSDTTWNIQYFTYDAYGNQTRVWTFGNAANGWPDTIIDTTYDSVYRAFPIRRYNNANGAYDETAFYYGVNAGTGDPAITDAKAQWGAIGEWCGVNEVCTRYAYDDYGRTNLRWEGVTTSAGWGTATNATVVLGYAMYGSSGLTRNVITEWRAPRCYGNFNRKVYNGLGQLIQLQGPNQDWRTNVDGCNPGVNAKEVDVNYAYDALGNQNYTGVPAATTASYINRAPNWGAYTLTTYDVLGRPKSTAAPNGETTEYKYVGRTSRVVAKGYGSEAGTNRVLKWTETNALGQLYRIRTYNKPFEEGGSSQAEIVFTHDLLGNLTAVTHPSSLGTTSMIYDVGGRKKEMIDISLGHWYYGYDRQGRLTSQTDACGNVTTLSYNTLGQLTGKSFTKGSNGTCNTVAPPPGGTYPSVSYTYGSSGSATGQLTEVKYTDNSYSKSITYHSSYGFPASETVKITGGAVAGYTTNYGYDSYLRPTTTTYPDGEVLTQQYNSMGLPAKLVSSSAGDLVDGTTNVSAVSDAVNYDEAGRLTQMRFPAGGNLWQTRGYFGWTATNTSYPGDGNGRLYYIHTGTTQGGLERLNLAHHYDSFGNLKYYYDNTAYNTFGYDDQNRVIEAYNPNSGGNDYVYDSLGRITQYEGVGQTNNTTFPAFARKNSGYTYDANGNAKSRAGRTLTWDVQNRLKEVKNGSVTEESYLYDPDGQRVKKTAGSSNLYYPFAHYEIAGSTITKYYFFAGQRVAMNKGGTLYYLHSDHLGSTVLTTQGTTTVSQQYCAYGRKRSGSTCPGGNSLPTGHTFTGQKLDGTGLQYFNARYYDPVIGTFISPDTIVPDATNVFDYNRYMYGLGNPVKFSDPTGHLSQDEIADYYGYTGDTIEDVRTAMMNDGWAGDIVNWLSNPDTQFGDVFTYYDSAGDRIGEAMLSLFDAGSTWSGRQYRGGFYGLTGADAGIEVTNSRISSFDDDAPLATELETIYTGNYNSLPRRTGADGHNYYDPAMYTYYRKRDLLGVGLTAVGGGATTAVAVGCASNPAGWIACMGGVAGLTSTGTTAGGVALTIFNPPSPPTYPVILTSRLTGNPPNLYSIWAPQGR